MHRVHHFTVISCHPSLDRLVVPFQKTHVRTSVPPCYNTNTRFTGCLIIEIIKGALTERSFASDMQKKLRVSFIHEANMWKINVK